MSSPKGHSITVAIYSHPTYYPPLLNAIDELSGQFEKLTVFSRNLGAGNWTYPEAVSVKESGEWRGMRAAEMSSTAWKIRSFYRYCRDFRRLLRVEKPAWVMVNDPISLWALRLQLPHIGYKPKIWYHSHDITEMEGLRKYSVGYFAARSENTAFRILDLFTLPAADRISFYPVVMMRGVFRVVPNYPSLRRMRFYPPQVWKDGEPLKIIYQGRVSDEHGLEELIGHMRTDRSVSLTIIGPGDEHFIARLKQLAETGGLSDRVQIRPPVGYADLQAITAAHHAGWAVNEPVNLLYRTAGVASNKIYEYAASGLPIFYFRDEQYEKYLQNFDWAFACNLESEEIGDIINKIKRQQESLSAGARNSFESRLHFSIGFREVLRVVSSSVP